MFRLSAVPNSHGLRIELTGRLDVRGTGAVGLVGVVVRVGDVVGHTRSGLCRGRDLAPVVVIEQRADGDGRWRLGRLGTRRRRGRGLTRECAELVGQPLHLRLELDDFLTIGPVQRIDELADLLHLQPQVRAQHDQIVQTRTHHAAIRRKHRIAVIFVKLAENPREIACRIVDLHVLPVRHRGDGRAGKQHVAIREPAMHRAGDERPQALRLDDPAPARRDFRRHMARLPQPLDPGGQLGANLPGGEYRIRFGLQEIRPQPVNGADGRAHRRAIIQSKQIEGSCDAIVVRRHHHGRAAGERAFLLAVNECKHRIQGESETAWILGALQRPGGLHSPGQALAAVFGVACVYVIHPACGILHHGLIDARGVVGVVGPFAVSHAGHDDAGHRRRGECRQHKLASLSHTPTLIQCRASREAIGRMTRGKSRFAHYAGSASAGHAPQWRI